MTSEEEFRIRLAINKAKFEKTVQSMKDTLERMKKSIEALEKIRF